MKSSIPIFLLLALTVAAQSSTPDVSPSVLKTEGGRFVFGQIGPMRADQYLLDTKTGRLWEIVLDENKRKKLQAVPFIGIVLGEDSFIPDNDEAVAKHREISQQSALNKFQQALEEATKQKK